MFSHFSLQLCKSKLMITTDSLEEIVCDLGLNLAEDVRVLFEAVRSVCQSGANLTLILA